MSTMRAAFLSLALATIALASPAMAATYMVNAANSGQDAAVGDGVCETSTGNGQCTFVAAVQESNATLRIIDTIQFAVTGTVSGGACLRSSANIVGPAGRITITGGGTTSALCFGDSSNAAEPTVTYNVSNVIATRGFSRNPSGGGSNDGGSGLAVCSTVPGTVNLSNVDVTDSITQDEFGGGVAVCSNNTLNWVGGLVRGNVGDSFGGGIYSIGTLNLSNVTVQSNRVQTSANAATTSTTGGGGGIYATVLTMTGGGLLDNSINVSGGVGGGLAFQGSTDQSAAVLTAVTFNNNSNANGDGGGMAVTRGQLLLSGVLLQANTASRNGGGVYVGRVAAQAVGGSLSARQSTFSANTAASGGGVFVDNAVNNTSSLVHSSFVGNRANAGPALAAGDTVGASAFPGDAAAPFNSNLFSGNQLTAGGASSCNRSYLASNSANSGYNLSDDASCGFTQATDRQNTPAMVAALANKGGATLTHALLVGSPAIDGGHPDFEASALDARGAASADGDEAVVGVRRDIGAYEFGGFGALRFTQAETIASEASAAAQIEVRRFANTALPLQVAYATANAGSGSGFASADSDYTASSGTLNWVANNTASQRFSVAINNDGVVEPEERFAVALSALTSTADFGAPITGLVRITDSGAAAGGATGTAGGTTGTGGTSGNAGGSGAATGSTGTGGSTASGSGGGGSPSASLLGLLLLAAARRQRLLRAR